MNNKDLKFASTLYVVPKTIHPGQEGIPLAWELEQGDTSMIEFCQPGCFDGDTEVLTSTGWKYWKDVVGNEEFLSVDPDSGSVQYVPAVELVKYRYSGTMQHFIGRSFDLMTTPDHNHYVRSGTSKTASRRLVKSSEFTNSTNFVDAAHGVFQGKSPAAKQVGQFTMTFDDYVTLMGWYLSEGCCFDKKEREALSVISVKQHKEAGMAEIRPLVERAFGKRTHGHSAKTCELYVDRETGAYFQEFGHAGIKYIPEDIKNASHEHILMFLNAFLKGDGSDRVKRTPFGESRARNFFTSSKRMADDLMELLVKTGNKCSLTIREPKTQTHHNGTYTQNGVQYVVNWLNTKSTNLSACTLDEVPYNDFVYDVTLENYHTLFVRRNGKVTISGNCGCTAEVEWRNGIVTATYNDTTKNDEVAMMPGRMKTVSKNIRVFLKDGKPLKVKNERGVEAFNAQKASITLFFHVNVAV